VESLMLKLDYGGFCERRGEAKLDYQRKVVPFLRDAVKAELTKTKTGMVWRGLSPRQDGLAGDGR
jgi:hypothetical protein